MIFYIYLLILCIIPTLCIDIHVSYDQYLSQFNKPLLKNGEYNFRKQVYDSNLKFINEFNRRNETFQLGLTRFTDLTSEEYSSGFCSCSFPISSLSENNNKYKKTNGTSIQDLPSKIDWRSNNVVSRVRDQGNCGSCYAFAILGSIESLYAIRTGTLYELSPQQVVDCSVKKGNSGCSGGSFPATYNYIQQEGLTLETSYPYIAVDQNCQPFHSVVNITGYEYITDGDETILQQYVSKQPVAVLVSATQPTFQHYIKGVLTGECSGTNLNHATIIVGYGIMYCSKFYNKPINNTLYTTNNDYRDSIDLCQNESNDISYWIMKNSWGPNWGENGYIRILKGRTNKGLCGLAQQFSIPSFD
ncbi:hypothetical protein WA158_001795 [Blastocystis sp. Blastoise]